MTKTQKILGITGWKNSGKTTLTERLVAALVARGYRIATVKHAHHAFDIDQEGRDSWRHRKAGASEVAIVSSRRWAIIHELDEEQEPPLSEVLSKMAACDLILVEGYKREGHPKIEVRRKAAKEDQPLAPGDPSIIAIASDRALTGDSLPVFDIDQIEQITAFVIKKFLTP
ncbi:MAG: molybdopterin-guanine dinucleotide biosynthesis protein B [Rhizobiaceae bacterium]